MRTYAILAALALLAGCSGGSEVKEAEARYEFLKSNNAPTDELCAAAREVQDAATRAQDTDAYRIWRMRSDADCIEARLERMR